MPVLRRSVVESEVDGWSGLLRLFSPLLLFTRVSPKCPVILACKFSRDKAKITMGLGKALWPLPQPPNPIRGKCA